jgi:hypothetical protein
METSGEKEKLDGQTSIEALSRGAPAFAIVLALTMIASHTRPKH